MHAQGAEQVIKQEGCGRCMALQEMGVVLMLTVGSIWDIRRKKIPAGLLILNVLFGVALIAVNRKIDWRQDWYLYAVGILMGIILLFTGRFCGGCIGTADGIMTAVIGGIIGYQKTLLLLMYAVLAAAVFSILLIVMKKAGRRTTIPFLPFMLLGYIIILYANFVS